MSKGGDGVGKELGKSGVMNEDSCICGHSGRGALVTGCFASCLLSESSIWGPGRGFRAIWHPVQAVCLRSVDGVLSLLLPFDTSKAAPGL